MATIRICSVEGCDKRHFGKGYCRTHYARWRKNGDPLKLNGTPPGELERYYREVVIPYDGDECLIWPYSKSSSGYGRFSHNGRDQNVSRVLCEEVNGPPPTPRHEAAHSCGSGNLGCVSKRHLSWKTPAENQMDRVLHGTSNRGERCWSAKLTETDVREIRSLLPTTAVNAIARRFGVSHGAIIAIRKKKSWYWLE